MSLHATPIHRALTRPNLWMGGPREPMMLVAGCAVALPVMGQNLVAIAAGALLMGVAIPTLRRMAKADPRIIDVYRRQLRYHGYYPARSRPYRGDHTVPGRAALAGVVALIVLAFYLRYWAA